MYKNKNKSKQVKTFEQYEDSTQVLTFTKKPHCSSKSENAKQSLLHFKFTKRNVKKSALEYLDLEEYTNNMDLKNRTKCAANSQFDQPDFVKMTKLIYNPDHNVELGQGDNLKEGEQGSVFNYITQSNSLDNADSSIKHASDKIDVIDYNNNNVDEWNYNQLEHASKVKIGDLNKRIDNLKPEYILNPVAKKPGFLVVEQLKSQEKYTNTPEYRSNQRTQFKQKSYKDESKNINKLEYIYFDKSDSDEENEYDEKMKQKQINKTDYSQMPVYDMEKTLVKDKSKF